MPSQSDSPTSYDMRSFPQFLTSPSPPPSYPTTGSNILMGRSSYQLFMSTRSRVIRIFNLPKDASTYLTFLFHPATPHAPVSLWSLREEYGGRPPGEEHSVWAVFKTHEQASAALVLSGGSVSVATALESDLEPFLKLSKVELRRHSVPNITPPASRQSFLTSMQPPAMSPVSELPRLPYPVRQSHSISDLRARGMESGEDYGFTLSSNPPNPRNSFRQGDWICGSVKCAAHNFMRNSICIGCGNPRPASSSPSNTLAWPRVAASPRFNGVSPSEFINVGAHPVEQTPRYTEYESLNFISPSSVSATMSRNGLGQIPPYSSRAPAFPPSPPTNPSALPSTVFPSCAASNPASLNVAAAAVALKLPSILTPSGRAFSIGGKVQNVSSDPLTPCVMYWPDNEPLPEPGQIRPLSNIGTQPPPILNTGNKGPIEQQPGDWLCRKCDYLNWRRRKVCQTCFPYAEGNTDGVSASVQAERIAMLAQVLGVSQYQSQQPSPPQAAPQLLANQPQPQPAQQLSIRTGHRSSISTPPNDAVDYLYCSPTSPGVSSPESDFLPTNRPLLPSFLDDDDYATSPTTSPSSIGSSSPQSTRGATLRKEPSSSSLSFGNGSSIWALKSEEVGTTTTTTITTR
ncbi:hypothetical protein BU17DRAFT_96634 [Hysterangium stoloniferum]|nr:hypothetical protein BU17DRAFT_96634 [Hysterangium stoloniferum]